MGAVGGVNGFARFVFFLRYPVSNGDDVAVQHGVNLATLGAGGEHDAGDELADGGDCLVAILRMVEGLGQPLDLAAIELGAASAEPS